MMLSLSLSLSNVAGIGFYSDTQKRERERGRVSKRQSKRDPHERNA